ncbi:MAG TPA: ribosome biogenesis GTPase Der [Syntrophales bacterium]|nr:ribosome biogenesis GTPase Der [Syntrophales bacterium]HQB30521.1 ribosome biogenesis GTPase Der [Syntrophales bacterium]HQN79062.1 ribosome biogenesis GTPase Der [Syntrophales bacterium]HQQ28229.1 ribosome biogenesis GTPase Der [Syntrophales bacterium]
MKPLVAIVGRPNVGKSTLFNRLSTAKKAIVLNEPGVTRDRNYGDCKWKNREFIMIDTGGFEPVSRDALLVQMREQALLAMEEADAILFLMDGREGLTPADLEIVGMLRKVEKPVLYGINKMDTEKQDPLLLDFYRIGADRLYPLSAEHGLGIAPIMDDLVDALPPREQAEGKEEEKDRIRIAVIGKPNVGKSSLVNRILGFERTIVSETPGTTRDAIDTPFELSGKKYVLIDTAGIRRKSRISLKLEKYTVMEAIAALNRSDIALLLIDGQEGITEQDAKIAGIAFERGVAPIIVVNKWDLVEKDERTMGQYALKIKDTLKFLDFAPILSVSAVTGQRVLRIFEVIDGVFGEYTKRIPTGELNRKMEEITAAFPPPLLRGRRNPVYFGTQFAVKPPSFVFFVRDPSAVHFSYERYLANRIREAFDLGRVPIRLIFRKKAREGRK